MIWAQPLGYHKHQTLVFYHHYNIIKQGYLKSKDKNKDGKTKTNNKAGVT
jgi:hypothetical protein